MSQNLEVAHLLGNIFSLSETFIVNQITGLIDEGEVPDLYTRSEHCETDVHEAVSTYRLKERTCTAGIPSNPLLRILMAIPVFFLNFPWHPIFLLRSINVWNYGIQAFGGNLLFWTVSILNKNDGSAEYDIVHCHFGHRGNIGVFLRDIGVINGKIVTTFYGRDISEFPETFGPNFYDDLFKNGDLFLVLSKHMKQKLIDLGAPEEHVTVHPLGIDTQRFKPADADSSKNRVTLLSVGRFVEKKGFENALLAVSQLSDRDELPEYRYVIAGDGPLRDSLESIIEQKNLQTVKLAGWKTRSEIMDLYKRADIFLAPSITSERGDEEGTPTVIYEAMSMQLPVISTNHAGIPEQVQDGETGLLVEEGEIDELTEKLEYLLLNESIRNEMGKRGRERVKSSFDIKLQVKKLMGLYNQLQ